MNLIPVPIELPAWITELLKRMIAPAAEEAGQMGRDLIKYARARTQIRFFEKLRQRLDSAHVDIKHVSLPLLSDILQRGTIEEDPDLQTLWVNLLANAADSREHVLIRTAFPQILSQISKDEALYPIEMLEVNKKTTGFIPRYVPVEEWEFFMPKKDREPSPRLDAVSYDNLRRLRLIELSEEMAPVQTYETGEKQYEYLTDEIYVITSLGVAFIEACQMPKTE